MATRDRLPKIPGQELLPGMKFEGCRRYLSPVATSSFKISKLKLKLIDEEIIYKKGEGYLSLKLPLKRYLSLGKKSNKIRKKLDNFKVFSQLFPARAESCSIKNIYTIYKI